MHVAELEVPERAVEVRATHEAEVVDGKLRAQPVGAEESDHGSGVLGQFATDGDAARSAAQDRAVVLHVGVSTAEVRSRRLRGERPVSLRVEGGEVPAADVRMAPDGVGRRTGEDRISRRAEDAEQRMGRDGHSHPQYFTLGSLGRSHIGDLAVVQRLGDDARLERSQQSDVGAADRPAQLGGRPDGLGARLVQQRAVRVFVPFGRRLSDPARIENLVGVAAVGAAERDSQRRLEQVESFGEEGPLLGEERLEGGDVQDALIRLDLAEIGIDRSDQGQVARQRIAQIEAGAADPDQVVAHPE